MQSVGGNVTHSETNTAGGLADKKKSIRFVLPRVLRRPYRVVSRFADGGFTVPRMIWFGLFAVALGGSSVAGWVSQKDDVNMLSSVGAKTGFQIEEIQFRGNDRVTSEEMEIALGSQLDQTLFDFDAGEARKALLHNPWIESARVVKVYPDVVTVEITERRPFAIWQEDGAVHLVSAAGVVLSTFKNGSVYEGYAHLPQVVGVGGNIASAELISVVKKFDEIKGRTKAYVRVADRRWDLELSNGVRIRLPEHGVESALAELMRMQIEEQVLDRDILAVDMRLPDRTFVQLSDASSKQHQEHIEAIKGATKKAVLDRLGRPI